MGVGVGAGVGEGSAVGDGVDVGVGVGVGCVTVGSLRFSVVYVFQLLRFSFIHIVLPTPRSAHCARKLLR